MNGMKPLILLVVVVAMVSCAGETPTTPSAMVNPASSLPASDPSSETSSTTNVHDVAGTWCANTVAGQLGPGSPGGCGDFEIDLTR